jgi:hypothetical protein
MMASVKVIEITPDGVGTVAFEENSIQAHYPPHVPDEGTPRGNDYSFYLGTISAFSDELVNRFVPHAAEEE